MLGRDHSKRNKTCEILILPGKRGARAPILEWSSPWQLELLWGSRAGSGLMLLAGAAAHLCSPSTWSGLQPTLSPWAQRHRGTARAGGHSDSELCDRETLGLPADRPGGLYTGWDVLQILSGICGWVSVGKGAQRCLCCKAHQTNPL